MIYSVSIKGRIFYFWFFIIFLNKWFSIDDYKMIELLYYSYVFMGYLFLEEIYFFKELLKNLIINLVGIWRIM